MMVIVIILLVAVIVCPIYVFIAERNYPKDSGDCI
jgi:hypothetical protein